MKKIIILVLIVGIITLGCSNNNDEMIRKSGDKLNDYTIETLKVKEISDNYSEKSNYRIIDVRENDEYSEGHIKEAINIPLGEIENIDISKNKDLIVYCQSGARSYQAFMILNDLDYNVKDMGGINEWNYELEK